MCAYKWAICVQEAIEGRKHPYVNSTHTNIVYLLPYDSKKIWGHANMPFWQ